MDYYFRSVQDEKAIEIPEVYCDCLGHFNVEGPRDHYKTNHFCEECKFFLPCVLSTITNQLDNQKSIMRSILLILEEIHGISPTKLERLWDKHENYNWDEDEEYQKFIQEKKKEIEAKEEAYRNDSV